MTKGTRSKTILEVDLGGKLTRDHRHRRLRTGTDVFRGQMPYPTGRLADWDSPGVRRLGVSEGGGGRNGSTMNHLQDV